MRGKLWMLSCLLVLGGTVLVGCGDDDGGGGDAGMGETDAGGGPSQPVATVEGGGAPDFECLGNVTAPAAGDPVAFTATFTGPLNPMLPDGTVVEFFTANEIAGTCTAPGCVTATTTGNVASVSLPANAFFAYRVPMTSATAPTIGYFRPAPAAAGENTSQTVIGNTVLNVIPGLFNRTRLPGTTVVSGAAYDCQDRAVGGVEARVFIDGERVVQGTERTDPFVGYLDGAAPNGMTFTTVPGAQFAVANVDPGTTRLELWAVLAEGEEPTRIACEEFASVADAVMVVAPPVLRSDYPEGSGCR